MNIHRLSEIFCQWIPLSRIVSFKRRRVVLVGLAWFHSVPVLESSSQSGGLLPLHLHLLGDLALDTARTQEGDTAVTAAVSLIE